MTVKGIYKSGVIRLEPGVTLPEGTEVEVSTLKASSPTSQKQLPGFGIWKDYQGTTDSAELSLQLRRSTERRTA